MKGKVLVFIILMLLPATAALEKEFCDGCIKKDLCYTERIQLESEIGRVYCSKNGEFLPVKSIGKVCKDDAECASFFCKGVCTTPKNKENFSRNILFVPLGVATIIGIGIIFSRHLKTKQGVKNERKAEASQQQKRKHIRIDYTKRNSAIENKVERSLGELQDVLKKRR
ncbi:hypothetical protein J4430_00745 [Candidatus Woesearchaeota archaeon]|nr:hypothetical protein [Candidatus Woesearchaeota archaeon]